MSAESSSMSISSSACCRRSVSVAAFADSRSAARSFFLLASFFAASAPVAGWVAAETPAASPCDRTDVMNPVLRRHIATGKVLELFFNYLIQIGEEQIMLNLQYHQYVP